MQDTPADSVVLDVRPDLAAGREPLTGILQAARALPPGASLVVLAPFAPEPLYAVLGRMGFDHAAEPLADGGYRVTFRRSP